MEKKQATVKLDSVTREWLQLHLSAETTVCKCDKCDLYYKPILGHRCKVRDTIE